MAQSCMVLTIASILAAACVHDVMNRCNFCLHWQLRLKPRRTIHLNWKHYQPRTLILEYWVLF